MRADTPSRSQAQSICVSGGSRGFPVHEVSLPPLRAFSQVGTHGLLGEDGAFHHPLHNEGVVFLQRAGVRTSQLQIIPAGTTHAEKEPLEVGGHLDGLAIVHLGVADE